MLPPPGYARRGGEIIAAMLAEVGIQAEIVPLEWAQWLDQVFKNKAYGMTIVSHTEPMDIGIYARDNYYFNYKSPAFNELMAKLDTTTDQNERLKLYGDAQRMLARGCGQRLPVRTAAVRRVERQGRRPVDRSSLPGQ